MTIFRAISWLTLGVLLALVLTGCPQTTPPPSAVAPSAPPVAATPPTGAAPTGETPAAGDKIAWLTSLPDAEKQAQAASKPIVVDMWATWCGPCLKLGKESFPSPEVQALADKFIWAKVDVDKNEALARQYKITGMPTILVLSGTGAEVDRHLGFLPGPELAKYLEQAAAKAK
ncbi:MAG TPA: thioredoxin domain-containing protein [Armatimonadota bacterium]|jgi:thiol-disulfide isomerase/thioredoxin